jgi:hypothetical protein
MRIEPGANSAEIMEIMLDSWKSIVDKSETTWALCDECYKSIQIYIKKRGSYRKR